MKIPEGLKPPVDEWVIIVTGALIGALICVVLPVCIALFTNW